MYKDRLSKGHTLELFHLSDLIFSSDGKWLHPLFQLENEKILKEYSPDELFLHDSISGIAAATLTIRLGIKHVNVDLISEGALRLYGRYGVDVSYREKTERIKCVTESLIDPDDTLDANYVKLRKKANLTSGLRLDVKNLSFAYDGKRKILSDVSFVLNSGDTVILEGENGSGKSTLIKCILSLLKYEGTVLFDGKPGVRDTAYIKQHMDITPYPLTSREVVSMAQGKRVSEEEIELSMRRTGCYHLKDRNYFSLSGGEKEKVNIARALAGKARLLLLDEPTANLDRESKENFAKLISSLTFSEMPTILLVSHDKSVNDFLSWPRFHLEGGHLD